MYLQQGMELSERASHTVLGSTLNSQCGSAVRYAIIHAHLPPCILQYLSPPSVDPWKCMELCGCGSRLVFYNIWALPMWICLRQGMEFVGCASCLVLSNTGRALPMFCLRKEWSYPGAPPALFFTVLGLPQCGSVSKVWNYLGALCRLVCYST